MKALILAITIVSIFSGCTVKEFNASISNMGSNISDIGSSFGSSIDDMTPDMEDITPPSLTDIDNMVEDMTLAIDEEKEKLF